jgi:hypothetical protein
VIQPELPAPFASVNAQALVDAARIGRLRIQGRSVREIAGELGYSRGLVHKTLVNSKAIGVANAAD